MTAAHFLHLPKGHIKLSPKVCPKEVHLIQWWHSFHCHWCQINLHL